MEEFIYNDYSKAKKVLVDLERELSSCTEFIFSVAFISESGITCLLETLKELEKRNINGKILTTDYLYFNTPKLMDRIEAFSNIELKVFETEKYMPFHIKTYIFTFGDKKKILMGSSNLTANALTYNKEWNSLKEFENNSLFVIEIMEEFNKLWDMAEFYRDIKNKYKEKFEFYHLYNKRNISKKAVSNNIIMPNNMQASFLEKFKFYHASTDRALLISATGTGKTYAAALAMKSIMPKRLLFLAHREQIAKKSMEDFYKVFSSSRSMLVFSGGRKKLEADFIFATVQSFSKDEILYKISPDTFDEIIIDEAHRAGAPSYLKIINYLKPGFYLGMTATPDRSDGFNLYKLFNYNIVYEIRLKQALEADLLCPFHYFGISELNIDGKEIDELTEFSLLSKEERINHLINNIKYYGYSGNRVKGLVFCRSKDEARMLSLEFNKRNFNTIYLTGEDSIERRLDAIRSLTNNIENSNNLDYIFTVDIFNEGIDIPDINQIILLRPTKSSIIFIQQLGRGLRKSENKEFVVILDFIANYENNFMIPIALSGNMSLDKDNMRNFITHANSLLYGSSSIHFDYIARQRIYNSIDNARLDTYLEISKIYDSLKRRVGRIPLYFDFDDYCEMDIARIFKTLGSYQYFLSKKENIYSKIFDKNMLENFEFISRELILSKKLEELVLLKKLIENEDEKYCLTQRKIIDIFFKEYGLSLNSNDILISKKILTNKYVSSKIRAKKYMNSIFLDIQEEDFKLSVEFRERIRNEKFRKELMELINYGIYRFKKKYMDNLYKDTRFVLYERYSYSDICKLFSFSINYVPLAIGGYKYDENTKNLPVFINYEIEENSLNSKYSHGFINRKKFTSMSKPRRNLESKEIKDFYKPDTKIYLFMRKNKKDKENANDFYFLGQMYISKKKEVLKIKDTNDTLVRFEFDLEEELRNDLFEYFTNFK